MVVWEEKERKDAEKEREVLRPEAAVTCSTAKQSSHQQFSKQQLILMLEHIIRSRFIIFTYNNM